MEILIRVVNGKLQIATNLKERIAILGLLQEAIGAIQQQPAQAAVQVPPAGLQPLLVGNNGHKGG